MREQHGTMSGSRNRTHPWWRRSQTILIKAVIYPAEMCIKDERMTATRRRPKRVRKKRSLKTLRELLRRGLYPVDSERLTLALWRARELSPN